MRRRKRKSSFPAIALASLVAVVIGVSQSDKITEFWQSLKSKFN